MDSEPANPPPAKADAVPAIPPLTGFARFTVNIQRASKGIVAFSGVLAATMSSAYPQYNALRFSEDKVQQSFAAFAHAQFRQSIGWSLVAVICAVVCIVMTPAIHLAVAAEDKNFEVTLRKRQNSLGNSIFSFVFFFGALAAGIIGFYAAAKFFDQSDPG